MNKKIYLLTYKENKRLKKYRLDEGEYSLGNNKDSVDIFIEEDCLANILKVTVDSGDKVYLILTKKHKNVLLNDSKISSAEEKIQIKNKDLITFKNCDISIKFKFKEITRERSRSKDEKKEKLIETNKIEKEKPKEDTNYQNKGYIKSEVIWNSVEFGDEKRKEKFLKLMGAKKKNQVDASTSKLDKKESEKLQHNFHKIESDLTKQYYSAIGRKPPI